MKPILELIRLEEKKKYGTFGVLRVQKELFCFTLEPPYHDNDRNISSIPAGQYRCSRYESAKWGTTFKVFNVPNRNGIIFHSGNVLDDTDGCILLGETLGKLQGDRAVLNSGKTFRAFMGLMTDYGALHLTITEIY